MQKTRTQKLHIPRRLILWLSLLLCVLLSVSPVFAAQTQRCADYSWQIEKTAEGPVSLRTAVFEDSAKSQVTMYHAEGKGLTSENSDRGYVVFDSLQLAPDARVYSRNTETGTWTVKPLREGILRGSCFYIESGKDAYFINLPGAFRSLEKTVVENVSFWTAYARCAKDSQKKGYILTLQSYCPQDGFTDCLVYRTKLKADWNMDNIATLWDRYTQNGTAKWLYDGYYRTVPTAYTPTCANGYYRCPASFLLAVLKNQVPLAKEAAPLTLACLSVVMEQQNALGFWETRPQSNWLYADYGIEAGFYDTRFNTDLMLLLCDLKDCLGDMPFKNQVRRYADFYKNDFIKNYSRETSGGGILPYDYCPYQQAAPAQPALTSLNHLAAETLLMYRLADALEEPSLERLADRLLAAIEDTGMNWVKDDHDFYYGVSADGIYQRTDYVSLTYDDLLTLQRWLTDHGRTPSPVITGLLHEKKQWMDANNVKDYLK